MEKKHITSPNTCEGKRSKSSQWSTCFVILYTYVNVYEWVHIPIRLHVEARDILLSKLVF